MLTTWHNCKYSRGPDMPHHHARIACHASMTYHSARCARARAAPCAALSCSVPLVVVAAGCPSMCPSQPHPFAWQPIGHSTNTAAAREIEGLGAPARTTPSRPGDPLTSTQAIPSRARPSKDELLRSHPLAAVSVRAHLAAPLRQLPMAGIPLHAPQARRQPRSRQCSFSRTLRGPGRQTLRAQGQVQTPLRGQHRVETSVTSKEKR